MAWERRGNNLYYYQKKRIAGSVVSWYVGRGEIAQEIASMDLLLRQKRNQEIKNVKQQIEEFGLLDNQVVQLSLLVNLVVKGFLIIAGFHKHKGQWRRRRNANRQRAG